MPLFCRSRNFPLPICAAVFFSRLSSVLPNKSVIPLFGPPVKSLDTRPKLPSFITLNRGPWQVDIAEKITTYQNRTRCENHSYAKFQRTGSVTDDLVGNVGRQQTAVTPENVATVSGIIQQNPMSSVRRIASETGLKHSSTQKILRKSLHMFPFKIQTHQAIPVRAVQQRVDFANQMLTMIDSEGFDVGCIWFTDEAHFPLNGFVNKQNWQFWGSENPYWCEAKPLYSPKVTVWAAVCSRGIIGPFFIRETVTSERYVAILEQFVATQQVLEDRPRTEWFMQDGARPHHTEQVFRFLDEYFGNRVIALEYPKFTGAGMDWPPYSPDLTPCDYFLWGTLKDIVYPKHPATLDELESAICVACESISVETLRNVMPNFILRLLHLCCANGEHFENIVM
ncbi:hypothetical protein AVEN_172514-1 [Araneus ventricosus]|uniref:Tc1-like transposase DDE domain-containing protein n=1 Tax=Araneus ventricosus TaxID=182803 RepID=A0A4Y2DQE7_ARAVE|nr:hypothetical protein AVEN_172514-1 [Araneus ventricosus]